MKIKYQASLLFLAVMFSFTACRKSAEYPSAAGIYEKDGWKYVYSIELEGTKSESRVGSLYQNGKIVSAPLGTIKNTPVGRFLLYPSQKYKQGWLNTLPYNKAVFEKDGSLTENAKRYVDSLNKKTIN